LNDNGGWHLLAGSRSRERDYAWLDSSIRYKDLAHGHRRLHSATGFSKEGKASIGVCIFYISPETHKNRGER